MFAYVVRLYIFLLRTDMGGDQALQRAEKILQEFPCPSVSKLVCLRALLRPGPQVKQAASNNSQPMDLSLVL